MVAAARFFAGLFGTQLLCATWLLFVCGVDIGVITPIGFAGSLFTLYCIVGTGSARPGVLIEAPARNNRIAGLARTLWGWSTKI